MNTYDFIQKSVSIHGNKYDYSKVKYSGSHTPVEIICPIHGSFYQVENPMQAAPLNQSILSPLYQNTLPLDSNIKMPMSDNAW